MSTQANVETIQAMYAAFDRGEIDRVLAHVADDCDWWVAGPEAVPYAGSFRGREGVARFFQLLASNVEYEVNEVQEVIAQDETVVVLGHDRVRVRTTGRPLAKRWAMVFNMDAGRVAGFRAYEDTNAIAAAFTAG